MAANDFFIIKVRCSRTEKCMKKIEEQLISQSEPFNNKFKSLVKSLVSLIEDDSKTNTNYILTGWTNGEHYLLKNRY